MYIKIHSPKNHGNNSGSSSEVFQYLEKENIDKDLLDQEAFFSHADDRVSCVRAIHDIDSNKRGLKEKEAKFFMITVNPSEKELKHINNDPEKLRAYTRNVMDQYAKNFNREVDGKPIEGKDLVYFAKIEYNRRYAIDDPKHRESYIYNQEINKEINQYKRDHKIFDKKEIKSLEAKYQRDEAGTVILPGNLKPGLNTHVHVIVSRKDRNQRVSLSPLANARSSKNHEVNGKKVQIGFNRKEFVQNCEIQFDKQFAYNREYKEKFEYKHKSKHEFSKVVNKMIKIPRDEKELARRIVTELFDKDKKIQRMMAPVSRMPMSAEQLQKKIMDKAVDQVAKMIAGGANPTAAAIKMTVKKVIDLTINSPGLSL